MLAARDGLPGGGRRAHPERTGPFHAWTDSGRNQVRNQREPPRRRPGWRGEHLAGAAQASAPGWAYVTAMWPIDRPPDWVGRGAELAILRASVEAVGRGEGAVVWAEGEATGGRVLAF